ncbi:hypothetical protein GH714_011944 [Hevea brasiliensis]|uniref:Uncharacterized protein n=1 Tax=Hevea brasiliensis TaxID=3981 RepID=A0A6A6LDI3_HEVBR|nr:hypothetical protein GH714_011944 [Hevea brasiliensis]
MLIFSHFLFGFIPNGHTISTHITGTIRERQDATGYTWKDVSLSTRNFYWQQFMKKYQWNATDDGVIKDTWDKVASFLYNRNYTLGRRKEQNLQVAQSVWDSWIAHWSTLESITKSRIVAQNWHSETGGPGSNGGYGGLLTAYATLNSQDDESQEISINVNHLYFDIVVERRSSACTVWALMLQLCTQIIQ